MSSSVELSSTKANQTGISKYPRSLIWLFTSHQTRQRIIEEASDYHNPFANLDPFERMCERIFIYTYAKTPRLVVLELSQLMIHPFSVESNIQPSIRTLSLRYLAYLHIDTREIGFMDG